MSFLLPGVVTEVLMSTVGFVCGKARDSVANKLKDGDLTHEKLREGIIRDLTDIKSKLKCLSLKDLNSSYSFLKEGVKLLNEALETSNEDRSKGLADEATRVVNDSASGILSAALSLPEAIQRLKISSKGPFISATGCFTASRERATDAFNDESLSIEDRIMACKLRVAARILETGLEDPTTATTSCVSSLKELHELPAVREMFSVFFKGGWKSKFRKAERFGNMMSVLFINHAVFDFAARYSSKYPNVFTWPEIEITDRQFNPILSAPEILTSEDRESVQQLNRVARTPSLHDPTVNSRGELITSSYTDKRVTLPYPEELVKETATITVDSDDNVYAIVRSYSNSVRSYENIHFIYVLWVFDGNYNIKHKCFLNMFGNQSKCVHMAVDKDKNIVMIIEGESKVFVLDRTRELKYEFECDGEELYGLSISNTNNIMISSRDPTVFRIYTPEGDLKSTINAPKHQLFLKTAYHYRIGKIIVLAYHVKKKFTALLCYSEAGELEHTVYLKTASWYGSKITSHPTGPFAVLQDFAVIYI